jgi:hypothetical protein
VDRIPVWTRFSAPVQTGPGFPPSSCTTGTVSFPGGKLQPGREADHSPTFQFRGHGTVELYLYPPSEPHRAYNGIILLFLLPLPNITLSPDRGLNPNTKLQCCPLRGHGTVELYLYPPSEPHRAYNGIILLFLLPLPNITLSPDRGLNPNTKLQCCPLHRSITSPESREQLTTRYVIDRDNIGYVINI